MSKLFANKYHTQSIRLPERDYSSGGGYFLTICVDKKECLLGEVIDGEINLSEIGKIVEQCRSDIPNHFPNVELDEYVIMPNHFHGILYLHEKYNDVIQKSDYNPVETSIYGVSKENDHEPVETSIYGVSKENDQNIVETSIYGVSNKPLHAINRVSTKGGITGNKNPMLNKNSLGYIIRWFKGKTSFQSNKLSHSFHRQSGFYEHVIRNNQDLKTIKEYIQNNPYKRQNDEYYVS